MSIVDECLEISTELGKEFVSDDTVDRAADLLVKAANRIAELEEMLYDVGIECDGDCG